MILNKFRFVGVDMNYKVEDCFLEIRNGISIKQGIVAGGFPITRIETLADDKFNRDRMGYAGITEIDKYSDYVLEDGDLLMSHINSPKYLGRTVVYHKYEGEVFIHGMNLLKLRTNRDILCPDFAEYLFASFGFRSQISKIMKKSVNQASFSVSDLRKISVKIPSLSKQREIINKLHRVKQIVNDRNIQLEMFDELIKSRFVEMFGDPKTNPKKWLEGTVRDIVTEVKYGTSRPAVEGGKYKYIRMNNITYNGELDLSEIKYIDIPKREIDKCIARKGDLLFNRTNSKELVGKTCVYNLDKAMVIAGYIIRVRMNEKALPEYLSAVLNSKYGKETLFGMCKAIVGQANINAQELQDIKIVIPPLELQYEFVNFKNQVDKLKVDVHKSLCETQVLFDSLMKKYFG